MEDALEELDILAARDLTIHEFSDYHWRIEGRLDIWPTKRKWYDISQKRGGTYDSLLKLIKHIGL